MRVLITGAAGQLGRDLQHALTGELHGLTRAELDIANRNAVAQAVARIQPDWLINAAAFTDVDRAESAMQEAFAVNARGAANLAEAAARAGIPLIHISTDYVFDGLKGSPYTEDDVPNPLSVYGRSKYEGERRVLASGASVCVLRTAWLYGRWGKNFVNAIREAAARGGPLRVVSDQVGSPTATADLARAIAELMQTPARGMFHVVNAGACSRYEFARAIVGDAVEIIPISSADARRAAPRPKYGALTSTRWEAAGLTPLRSWQAALARFLSGPA